MIENVFSQGQFSCV